MESTHPLHRILIMAGGTGGHVFPGLAIAKKCREKGIEVHWLGTHKGLEARVVPRENFPIHFISISGWRGKKITDWMLAPFRLFNALWQSYRIIQKIQPDVVLGMGGFASGPGGIASWIWRCPLIIHEQNAKPGLTNRGLSYFATKIAEGFPGVFSKSKKNIFTGNPVRSEIMNIKKDKKGREKPLHLLVLGGSLGASAINAIVPRTLIKLDEEERPLVYHQTGEKQEAVTKAEYAAYHLTARIVPFIEKMEEAYEWADIVICRAGALTVAEICAVGLPAIFIPFPHAADDHQTANATYLLDHQAAMIISQSELTEEKLVLLLNKIMREEERLKMGEAAYSLRRDKVTDTIIKVCEETVR